MVLHIFLFQSQLPVAILISLFREISVNRTQCLTTMGNTYPSSLTTSLSHQKYYFLQSTLNAILSGKIEEVIDFEVNIGIQNGRHRPFCVKQRFSTN